MFRSLKSVPFALPLLLMSVLAAMGFVLTSCNSGNQAQVRFVHAIANIQGDELNIEFNGADDFQGISFANPSPYPATGYTAVPAGSVTIEGFLNDSPTTSAFNAVSNYNLNAGSQYTLVATGTAPDNVIILGNSVPDNNTEPTDGNVNFRVFDASIDGQPSLAIYILQNNSQGEGPGVQQGTPVTMTVTNPTSSLSGAVSSYTSGLSFNSNHTGWTMYVAISNQTNPLFSAQIADAGSATEGSIRTIVLTDNTGQTGLNTTPLVFKDLN